MKLKDYYSQTVNPAMQKTIAYKNVRVVYTDRGSGQTILFLHGYLETKKIWDKFVQRFPDRYRVITMDLPGHGNSGTWGEVHHMEDLAGAVKELTEYEQIDRIFLVGHSMGGYVTLAFADLFPERLSGYCLFHSTCFADSEEKKVNREREISLIRCNKKRQIINVNIPKGFAENNLEQLEKEVEKVKQSALQIADDGIVAMLNGMMQRPDRTEVLKDDRLSLLLIGGMQDNYISANVFNKLVELAPHASVLWLEQSGHMGFIEEPQRALDAIVTMIKD